MNPIQDQLSDEPPVRVIHGADEIRRVLLNRSTGLVEIDEEAAGISSQVFHESLTPEEFVDRVIRTVEAEGDMGVRNIAQALDDSTPGSFEIPSAHLAHARSRATSNLGTDFQLAADRIRAFHEQELPTAFDDTSNETGQRWIPVDRAGIYVPGQAAPLVSTVLMAAIPAQVAGVAEVVVTTPVGHDGISPAMALALHVAGVKRVFTIGGAQAIAALAIGTESVPRCDVIAGPGNPWVVLAKRALYGIVGIDLLPGPTETLIIADATADAADVAADLIAQAEHGGPASPIALTSERSLATSITHEVQSQLADLPRGQLARDSFRLRGGVGIVDSLNEAINLANAYAPEHLCLLVQDAEALLPRIRHAGGVFLGRTSPEVLGDYVAGPSHVMPTGGTARFSSPLGVRSFLKSMSVIRFSGTRAAELAPVAARMARAEGLEGHARAAERRTNS